MLTRDEIPFGNINDVRETALALYDENERLKHDLAVVKEDMLLLSEENARLKEIAAASLSSEPCRSFSFSTFAGYANLIDGWREKYGDLEKENARLLKELDETEKLLSLLGEDCPKLQTKIQKLEIENARLREADESAKRVIDGLVATQDILQRDIDLLRAVVDAAEKYIKVNLGDDEEIIFKAFCELKAALEKVKL